MSQDALGLLKHLKTARARWPFPDVGLLCVSYLPQPTPPNSIDINIGGLHLSLEGRGQVAASLGVEGPKID